MNGGQLWLVMKFVFSCWMVCDMVTDCITTHSYHQACKIHHHNHTHENNTKQEFMSGSCGYFMASVLSFLLPMVFSSFFIFFNFFTSQHFICRVFSSVLTGLLYPVILTISALYLTGKELFSGNHNDAADTKFLNFYKLFEHLLEAFPQLVINIVYIINHGGVSANYVQTGSAVFSTGSLVLGLATGCQAALTLCAIRFGQY